MTATPQNPWTELAERLVHELEANAAAHDRDGTFVHANYESLRAIRAFSALVPTELCLNGPSPAPMPMACGSRRKALTCLPFAMARSS